MANELYHHGVLGMKWGVRRYQNTDGSYKSGAEGRYDPNGEAGSSGNRSSSSKKSSSGSSESSEKKKFQLSEGQKKALKVGAIVAGTALASYGAYKIGTTIHQVNTGKKFMDSLSPEVRGKVQQMLDENGMTSGNMFGKTKTGHDTYRKALIAKNDQAALDEARIKLEKIKANPEAYDLRTRENAVNSVNFWQKAIDEELGINSGYKKESYIGNDAAVLAAQKARTEELLKNARVIKADRASTVSYTRPTNVYKTTKSNIASYSAKARDYSSATNKYSSAGEDFAKDLLNKNLKSLGL